MKKFLYILILSFLSCEPSPKDANRNERNDIFSHDKRLLDSLFLLNKDSDKYCLKTLRSTLLIGNLFAEGNNYAILNYKENDTTSCTIILKQIDKKWDTVFSKKVFPVSLIESEDIIKLSDFNGDNIPDLKVAKRHRGIYSDENSSLYLFIKGKFTEIPGFDSIINATYDKATGNIYSYHCLDYAGNVSHFGVYKIADYKVKTIEEMNFYCCEDDSTLIMITGKKPYKVQSKLAYMHVHKYFAETVKEKCK
jgi:hypothetical protein